MTLVTRSLSPGFARIARFAAVGMGATLTDFTIFNLGVVLIGTSRHSTLLALNTLSFGVATAVSYILNSRFTFQASRDRASLARYVLVAIIGAAIYDTALGTILHMAAIESPLLLNLAKAAAVVLSATWNFLGFATFAFPRPRPRPRRDASAAP